MRWVGPVVLLLAFLIFSGGCFLSSARASLSQESDPAVAQLQLSVNQIQAELKAIKELPVVQRLAAGEEGEEDRGPTRIWGLSLCRICRLQGLVAGVCLRIAHDIQSVLRLLWGAFIRWVTRQVREGPQT